MKNLFFTRRFEKIFFLSMVLFFNLSFCQTGINTKSPTSTMDVNGDLRIRKEFRVGKLISEKGNAGETGQFLLSKGEGFPPEWTTVKIPIIPENAFQLTNTYGSSDTTGVLVTGSPSKRVYLENDPLNTTPPTDDPDAVWFKIQGLNTDFKINKPNNKVIISFQTMTHISSKMTSTSTTSTPSYTFACGFFIDNQLKSVRPSNITGTGQRFDIYTQIATIENLAVGSHTLEVACIPRLRGTDYAGSLAIGRPNPDSTNLNNFTAKSSLKLDVLEVLDN